MIFAKPLIAASKTWKAQDSLSKCIIVISLLLVLFAYLPTLQFDYVTQDQWRAFRYSTLEQTPYDRANACVETNWKFYVKIGRPLVWMTECVEHAAVAKISDFIYLRPIALSIVLATALYLGSVLAPIVGGLAMGVLAASAFLMAPGYSFMYLLGMPVEMVLMSIILAAASFRLLREMLDQAAPTRDFTIRKSWAPLVLFVSSCLIYPAWAFLVVPLALAAFGFDDKNSWPTRIKRIVLTLLFYLSAAVFYYIFVKITVLILLKLTGYGPDSGTYEVAVQLSPSVIWQRILEAAKYFYAMPLLNFNAPPGLPVVVLGLFSASTAWRAYKNKNMNLLLAIAFSGFIFMVGCVILLASISPWLFSRMDNLQTRILIPWYLFFVATSVGLIFSVVKIHSSNIRSLAPVFILMFFVVPVAAVQNKLSFLEVAVSGIEIQSMRSRLGEWLDEKGYLNQRYLLIVPPEIDRPAFAEKLLSGSKNAGENAVLASSKNPVSIPWMVNALLREREDHPVGKSIEIVDCGFDQGCVNGILAGNINVALGITKRDHVPVKSIEIPFVINNSALTSKQINPVIEHVVLPSIEASSQLKNYGPQGLLLQMQPGWHTEQNPKYPQTLNIDLHEARLLGTIGLLPQDGNSARAPKSIRIKVSNDGKSWVTAVKSDDVCVANSPNGWHNVKLAKQVKVRFLEIKILANCGDPDFLTLRGLRIE